MELHEVREELVEVEDRLKGLGAVDPTELQQAQEARTKLAQTKGRLETELTAVWEQAMPVALMGPYRKDFHDYLVREEKRSGMGE